MPTPPLPIVCAVAQGMYASGQFWHKSSKDGCAAAMAREIVDHAEAIQSELSRRAAIENDARAAEAMKLLSSAPTDPSDIAQRERMKPGTVQRVIDAALEELLRDGKDWDPVAFGARFGIDPEDATALRRFGEHERASILRWIYRNVPAPW